MVKKEDEEAVEGVDEVVEKVSMINEAAHLS